MLTEWRAADELRRRRRRGGESEMKEEEVQLSSKSAAEWVKLRYFIVCGKWQLTGSLYIYSFVGARIVFPHLLFLSPYFQSSPYVRSLWTVQFASPFLRSVSSPFLHHFILSLHPITLLAHCCRCIKNPAKTGHRERQQPSRCFHFNDSSCCLLTSYFCGLMKSWMEYSSSLTWLKAWVEFSFLVYSSSLFHRGGVQSNNNTIHQLYQVKKEAQVL